MLMLAMILAQAAPGVVPPSVAAGTGTREKLICKTEANVGSRLGGRRVCRTAAEMRDLRTQTGLKMDQLQRFQTNGQ